MRTLSPLCASRNHQFGENQVSYPRHRARHRRRISRPFIAVPRDTPMVPRALQPVLLYLIGLCGGGSHCEVSHPRLAAVFGVDESTAARWIYALRNLGVLIYTPRKISVRMNLPNRYYLPHLDGFFVDSHKVLKNEDQKPLELTTKTTTRCSPVPMARPAYSRSTENHPPEVRQRVESNAIARHHRLTRAHHRPDAFVGVGNKPDGYYSGIQPETAEDKAIREWWLARDRERTLRGNQ